MNFPGIKITKAFSSQKLVFVFVLALNLSVWNLKTVSASGGEMCHWNM